MPSVQKDNHQLIIEKVSTDHGEITVNLNLSIKLDGGNIQINANTASEEKIVKENKEFIPDEEFEINVPFINGFGKKI